jgi:flagellar hook-basal body complex protein FliE
MIDPISPPAVAGIAGGETQPLGNAAKAAANASSAAGADFTSFLGQLASDASNVLRTSEAISVAGIQGKAPVQEVVAAVMSAEQTLQSAIVIRDKVVQAYLEMSRMAI